MRILAEKVKADKKLVVATSMQLSDVEARDFWPVYDAYQKDLLLINRRRGAVIVAYADSIKKDSLTDKQAKKMLAELLAAEEAEVKLQKSYATKLEKVLPGKKIARYIQIENKIRALVQYELAAGIPLVK